MVSFHPSSPLQVIIEDSVIVKSSKSKARRGSQPYEDHSSNSKNKGFKSDLEW